jgi:hypothetical protein
MAPDPATGCNRNSELKMPWITSMVPMLAGKKEASSS